MATRSSRPLDIPLTFTIGNLAPRLYPGGVFRNARDSSEHVPIESADELLQDDYDQLEYTSEIDNSEAEADFEDCPFDIQENTDGYNSLLYRNYDVFIRKPPDPLAKRQFYVMHDFQYDVDSNIIINQKDFVVLCLLKVNNINVARLP